MITALLATLATIGATVTPTGTDPLTFTVKVTAKTEATQKAYALVQSASTPCAASFSASAGTVIVGGAPVSGTVSISHPVTVRPGDYVVCSWLGGGAPQSTAFSAPAPKASALTLRYFKTPSANIICEYSYGDPQFPPNLECAIKSGLKPPPARKKCDAGDYTDSMVFMELTGRARYQRCAGDPGPLLGEAKAKLLAYGKSWHHGSLRCTSRTSGLTCRNRSGHGWTLSRAHSKLV